MVNSQVISEVIDELKLDTRVNIIPSPIPVIEVGMKAVKNPIVYYAGFSGSGNSQIVSNTYFKGQEFYITNLSLSLIKDATSDMPTGRAAIIATINSALVDLISISVLTLTAQNYTVSIAFTHPVKIDRNTAISFLGGTTTVGNRQLYCNIFGYVDEVI